jgi:predicted transcriptional regulator/transcriptional regulator with XRE-family HTH domain
MVLTKALLGNKLRRLREERQLNQKRMAEQLGISASYLNLIEHDERPVTVSLLLKLGQVFGVDLQELSDDPERRLAAALREVFADAGLNAAEIDADEVQRMVAAAPSAARAMVDLYRAWRTAREDSQAMQIDLPSGRKQRVVLPTEEARDFFETHANYFPAIEDAAEALCAAAALSHADRARLLGERLMQSHGIETDIAPLEKMAGALRRFDPAARRLNLSQALPRASRHFHMAYQLGLLEAKDAIDSIIRAAKLSSPESETLCRVGLANYFAGAVLMPYVAFLAEARLARYDVELLMHRFDVSFEQAAHRLSTLQKPGDAGVPFFFVRADIAGNISKRFSAAGFHFSRFGGSCARFIVHEAFATPGLIRHQIARLPDGATFFAIARTLDRSAASYHAPVSHLAVGLGCDIARASALVYADGLDLTRVDAATEIGIGCRLCERSDCRQRAFPPLQHRLVVDETVKGPSAYSFRERQ